MKLKVDSSAVDPKQVNLNKSTAQLQIKSSNDDDEDDDNGSHQSADLLSECCEDEETPVAANTSAPQAPANLSTLTLVPMNKDECASALKKLKGYLPEQPDYLVPVPEKDQNTVRKTIVLEENDVANSHATSLEEVALGRSSVTGIRSVLISRHLCNLAMKGNAASITMLKESDQHAVFLNGEPLGAPVGNASDLNDQDILSLFGPVDFSYRIQLSS